MNEKHEKICKKKKNNENAENDTELYLRISLKIETNCHVKSEEIEKGKHPQIIIIKFCAHMNLYVFDIPTTRHYYHHPQWRIEYLWEKKNESRE